MTAADPLPNGHRRVAVVGVSEAETCGVRDHGGLLAAALEGEGVACTNHWLTRRAQSLSGARSEIREWADGLSEQLRRERPEAILLHYSVFSYSYRGFPLFVAPVLRALRGAGVPIVTVLHEFVYPWRRGGVRGKAWALSQAVALRGVMRASAAALVTAPFRRDWLDSQSWLPRREIALAPVFSNLPTPARPRPEQRPDQLVGLFGYAYEGAAVSLVLDAVALLRERGLSARLALLGAPGPGSAAAESWLQGARSRGIEPLLSFSGVLAAPELAERLAACDVLLHPEPSGPTSRKGTLAGSLASGTAVVAIDGPRSWAELTEAQAALVVAPTAQALADAVAGLLGDPGAREALGARGAEFAAGAMGVQRSARAVAGLLDALLGGAPRALPGRQPAAGPG
jgi:glycosyltransferase involved in cell wall biosynthesis